MHTIGTSHFVSFEAALAYYREYGYGRDVVARKLRDGEISIGKPEVKPIETLFVREGRYHIQVGY